MNRRQLLRLIVSGTAIAAGGGVAVAAALSRHVRWTRPPSITVISAQGDSRISLVREAVDYWNRLFTELQTPFRLGVVTLVVGSIPDTDVLGLGLGRTWRPGLPASLAGYQGDILVVLSDASFISCAAPRGDQVVLAIKTQNDPRMTPNIMRNVIAHELGHAIGLDHNADPTLLMCGRPAPCRPGIYRSEAPRFFPLSASEKARLLELYPSEWLRH